MRYSDKMDKIFSLSLKGYSIIKINSEINLL
jgi:hypothetical protein